MSEAEPSETEPEPPDEIAEAIREIDGVSDEAIRGENRIGDLAFSQETIDGFREVSQTLKDYLAEDDPEYRSPSLHERVFKQAEYTRGLLAQALDISTSKGNASEQPVITEAVAANLTWFKDEVRPQLIGPRLAKLSPPVSAEASEFRAEMEQLQGQRDALAVQLDRLRKEIEQIQPAVSAVRDAAGASAGQDLADAYESRASHHRTAWHWWLGGLIVSVAVAIVGTLIVTVWIDRPTGDALTAESVSRLLVDLLVIGLLLYLVRISSLQFRVHRHLEEVARSKATALTTFSRMVAVGGSEPIRDVLAATLAQAVFETGEIGFVDASADHITLVERAAASLPRVST